MPPITFNGAITSMKSSRPSSALLDNALLEPLARACVEEGRDDFMLVIAPLKVIGGTGSPANPLAVF